MHKKIIILSILLLLIFSSAVLYYFYSEQNTNNQANKINLEKNAVITSTIQYIEGNVKEIKGDKITIINNNEEATFTISNNLIVSESNIGEYRYRVNESTQDIFNTSESSAAVLEEANNNSATLQPGNRIVGTLIYDYNTGLFILEQVTIL